MRTERAKVAGGGERWQRYRWGSGGGMRERREWDELQT